MASGKWETESLVTVSTSLPISYFEFPISQRSLLDLLCHIVRRPPGEGEERQRRVLLARARERRAVDDEDVLHFVHLVELVERRALRVLAHPAAAVLVDG